MRRLLLFLLALFFCTLLAPAPQVSPSLPAPALVAQASEKVAWPQRAALERLAREQPLKLLELCIARYRQEVQTFRALLIKQERIEGTWHPEEEIELAFRDRPYSVWMHWRKGERLASCVLYVEGANDKKLLALPTGLGRLLGVVARDPDGPDARQASRYSIKESGLLDSALRTQRDWKAAADKGKLQVECLGIRKIPQLGDRPCLSLKRTCAQPEGDGFTEVVIHIDVETGLQIGSVMTGPEGGYGSYFYRDVEVNPDLPADQFEKSAVK